MSFKFEHEGKTYWAKEVKDTTEVYFLQLKQLAEKVAVLDGKFSNGEEVMDAVKSTTK